MVALKVSLLVLISVLVIGSVVFYLAGALCTFRFFAFTQPVTPISDEPVSVLIPVRGLDEGAWENWSSFCDQDYPKHEVLFGVMDRQDPAVPILSQLVAAFPDQVRLLTDLQPRGLNHQISNLSYLLEAAQYKIVIFADSDVRVSPQYIRTVTAPLADAETGIVTCCYIGHEPKSLGAAMAALGRGCDFIPSVLIARALDGGLQFAFGPTIATRTSVLDRIGGLHLNRIGSDYNLGNRTRLAGYRVELSSYILESDTGREGVAQVYQRETRWARTIRHNRGAQYYTMIFCYGTVYCIPLLLLSGFQPWAIALSLVTLSIRYVQSAIAIFYLNCPKLVRWLWALPLRDLLGFTIWVMGSFGQKVYWRGRELRVLANGWLESD